MKKLKQLPILTSDEEAEDFVANSDLTEYDLSGFKRVHFELRPKTDRVNMRFPKQLLDAVRAKADEEGIPYQRYIRRAVEEALSRQVAPTRKAG
jgi:predicted DNA binding CopG/RHH family protein